MCGGRGTRLDADVEKPLLAVDGSPMVERVRTALADSRVDRAYAVTAPHAPETAAAVDLPRIRTPGEGYVPDLRAALSDDRVETPVLTVAADLPLLDGPAVDAVLDAAAGSLTVAVPAGRKRGLGFSVDATLEAGGRRLVPAGINVVGDGRKRTRVTTDSRCVANVNRPADARRAEWLLAGRSPREVA
ncbi:MAG: NTP transferase domain-containing protein [Salinirussus sp.]